MTDSPHPLKDNLVNNDVYDGLRLRSLQQLAWGIEGSVGKFKLILARCNYASWRDRLIQRLGEISQVEIRLLVVQESRRTLYTAIREEFGEDVPGCVMVVGLERVQDLAVMLTSANQVREEFRKNFAFPLVLWIDDQIYKQLIQVAPDLESWAITRNFAIAKDDLIALLQQLAKQFFSNTLTLNLDAYFVLEAELAAANRELLDDAQVSQEVKANLASLLGLATQVNNKINIALEHYQLALALWQQLNNLERWGKTLGDIAFCYYLKAYKHEDITHPDWQATRHYILEYISFLSQAERPDLIANSILKFGVVLRDLQEWEQLKNLAGQALEIHQANNQAIELAKDYGFLAEVALAEERWLEANQFAQQALNVGAPSSATLPAQEVVVSNDLSFYRFILARSQYHLGDYQEAIRNLEVAKDIGNPLTDLRLYLKILSHLQKLYFQQKAYLQAYKMKQQQRSVEQQFGLRAFIGAGRLQATKQVGAQGLTPLRIDNKDSVAPEIAASGRQLDVERLIESMGRPDKKLIIICGESGVGKSSLVNAGLVPALKNKAIGIQDNLPVTMRVYTNWVEELGRVLGAGGAEEAEGAGERGSGGDKGELESRLSTFDTRSSTSELDSSTFDTRSSTSELDSSTFDTRSSTSELDSSTFDTHSSTSELDSSTFDTHSSTSELRSSTSNTQNPHSLFLTPVQTRLIASPNSLLSQLRENEQRNLRTILIFDQFEEFFFVYTEPKQRREFFEFLGECLNVLSVKVILSLRVDYLHYLLECNRFSSMKIIGNDILSNNVLYELGNFSPDDAKSIIQRLTEKANFQLQPALVEQLVQDLAGELGEVRPIELQVVGAQLQTENITTLAEYQQRGTKEELVKRYLDEVVNDCGVENQQVAELLLYLLTDEKGTRPLKTRAELERDLQALVADATTNSNKLDLVLEIFVKSGLVVLLPENPTDRYQLVHDYIATFIRQQGEPHLKILMARLVESQEAQRLSESKLNRLLKIALTASVLAIFGLSVSILTAVDSEIKTLVVSSEALFASQKGIDALKEGLKAGRKLKQTIWIYSHTKEQVQTALYQAVSGVREYNRFEAHMSGVNSVIFSPDRSLIASASADTTIKLWRPDGSLLKTLSGHEDVVNSISFSPDSQIVASASQDKTVKLWSGEGQLLATLLGHQGVVNSVSFSPDGQIIASASTDKTVKLWSRDGKLLKTLLLHNGAVLSVAWSPDGQTIASGSADKTVKLWSRDGKLLKTLLLHEDAVKSVAWSPDGKTIASASLDQTIKLWNLEGKLLRTLSGHSAGVTSVSFSRDGNTIASASTDETIKLWSSEGVLLGTLKGHNNWVNSVSFSPDGRTLASASRDKTIKLWRWDDVLLRKPKAKNDDWVTSISFSPDDRTLAAASRDKTIKLFSRDGKLLRIFTAHQGEVWGVTFSPDAKAIASASKDKTVKLWSSDGKLLNTLQGHKDTVLGVAWSPNGQVIASASKDKTVKLWSPNGKLLNTLEGHQDAVNWVSFSPDGKLASASDDKTVKIWDLDGKLLYTLNGHSRRVNGVAWSPDGQAIASVSIDSTVKIWSRDGNLLNNLPGDGDSFISVSFSPDGKTLAASSDNKVNLWNREGTLLITLKGDQDELSSVSFSPDSKTLATGSGNGTVIFQNLADIKLEKLLSRACNLLQDYLKSNQKVTKSDHELCK
ncbi:ribosome assembly protein 4 [Nostoc sp. CHAB 5784]|uniref:WD40 domain-containing protein n=1 Tax=Nostoc mirabile TaxID=2907820 RepID=UPI001E567A9C|nr:ribosome assembly protein 4 [Nostoc mirabile]MCC5663932.1 ribosome assembly protein 4 [Nostoc mirabile CHAB5784]